MINKSLPLLDSIAQTIFDKKGFNILVLDVTGISTITDFFVIAEGSADRHVIGIAQSILDTMSQHGLRPIHTEGLQSGDWIVLDFLDIIIHLFMPGLRERYSLEELWHDGQIVNVKIETKVKPK